MKLLEFINHLAVKCGKQNEQAIIDLLSRADLQNIDLADDVANSINNSLLTIDGAKNNPLLKSHFTALALEAADAEILNTIQTLELGDDFKTEISGVKNTYEKQRKLSVKLKESITALKAAQGKGDNKDIEKYTKQINDLNSELSQLKETTVPKSELEALKKTNEESIRDFMLHTKISGLKFANTDVKHEDNIAFANVILKNRLLNQNAIVVKDGNGLKLKLASDPALDYFDEQNKPVTFDDFMNKTFADSKILAVSGVTTPNTPPTTPPGYTGYIPPVRGQINTAKFDASVHEALAGLTN